jgi:starch phosphorylase
LALGDGQEHGDDPAWDAADATALYDLLESQVIPEFYTRNKQGIPTAWVKRMRESMASLTAQFSANRTVREYTEDHYLPAAEAYHARAADKGTAGLQMVNWRHMLEQNWAALRFGEVQVVSDKGQHIFEVAVSLGKLDPNTIRVELYADGVGGGEPEHHELRRARPSGEANGSIFSTQIPATRPASDYTARILPQFAGVAVPLEASQILWQR